MSTLRYRSLLLQLLVSVTTFGQNTVPQRLNVKEKIGWIPFDKNLDDPNFIVCDELNIEEYYQVAPSYGEGMPAIRKYIWAYKPLLDPLCEQDGYVIIRFVINCQGRTDRYRTKFMSLNYIDESSLNAQLQKKINQVVRNMGNWTPGKYEGRTYDCYQHLKFLFKDSQLVDVLF